MANIPIRDIPGDLGMPNAAALVAMDDGIQMLKTSAQRLVEAGRPTATEQQALDGTDNYNAMTALRVVQSINNNIPPDLLAGVSAAALNAAQSEANAAQSAIAADGSAQDSMAAAGTAAGASSTAQTSAGQAMTFRNAAEGFANEADASADRAETAEDGAVVAKDLAAGYASDMSTRSDTVPIYATTLGMTALSLPAGLNAFRTNGYAAAGDGGGWPLAVEVTNTGTLEPWQLQTNGGTRRWQLKTDVIKVEMLGGKGDFSFTTNVGTDNYAIFLTALRYVAIPTGSTAMGGPRIQFGAGYYFISQTVNVKTTAQIVGYSTGQPGGFTTRLVWPADTAGFIFHRFNTIGYGIESPTTRGADGTLLQNLCLRSQGGTDITKHAIWMRCRIKVVDCFIEAFPGNGIHVVASAGSTATREGNANTFEIIGGRITGCQNGIFIDGADANAGYVAHADCSANRAWGIFDASFLGNTFSGCHFNGNGFAGQVSFGGNRYYAIDETLTSTTEPGTNPAVWGFAAVGGPGTTIYPLWVSGTTYYAGGPFGSNSNNAQSCFVGGYVEGGQPPCSVMFPSCVLGGINITNRGTGAYLRSATWSNLVAVGSNSFEGVSLGSADAEYFRAWNQTAGTSRYARFGLYAGYLADGVTKRGAGRISARSRSATLTVNTEMSFDTWNGATNVWDQKLLIDGVGNAINPGASDLVISHGAATARWLKGWYGNVSVFPAASVTPTVNGEVTFQLTSNTQLTFKVKGSDGVVRSASVTLA
jgi:hypothetical protein